MRLDFISAHKNIGPLRKQFGLPDGSSNSYPNAKKITSHIEEVDISAEGLKTYRNLLVSHAAKGHALYKGQLKKKLNNQSRKGMTDKDVKTQLLVLDIDNMSVPGFKRGPATQEDVRKVAESVIAMMPRDLANVSYVAVASSSFGLKDEKVSVHIHMFIETPVLPSILKTWITSLNYTQDEIREKLELTPSKMHVKSVVDPCLAEPSRIVYITPPFFGPARKNPFSDDSDRFVLVEKERTSLDLGGQLDNLSQKSAIVDQQKNVILADLQKKVGINKKKRTKEKFRINNEDRWVITNPESLVMTMANYDDEFVRYNVGGGDSNAYWVRRDNPEVVYCFKPDEEPFLFSKAAPEAYQRHVEKFGEQYTVEVQEDGTKRRVKRLMYIDQNTDSYVTCEYDPDEDRILDARERKNVQVASEWMKYYGQMVPDPVPPIYKEVQPQKREAMYKVGDKMYMNTFNPSKYMRSTNEASFKGSYGMAWQIHVECPTITEVIFHMLGADYECFEHFINWLAFTFQTKDKAKTSWMLHGTEGTGKGLFFHRIIRPLFGQKYAKMNTLEGIADDKFNDWMEEVIFLFVDEFNMKGAGSNVTKTANILKNLVTEPVFMMRGMQKSQKERPQRLNFMFGTNDYDAMSVRDKRRHNIPPRQEIMLDVRMPSVTGDPDRFDKLLESELEEFAAFLRDFKVDKTRVLKILENKAREDAQLAGMSASDRFFEDLRTGNFGAFVDFLDKPTENLSPSDFMELKQVKKLLTACLEHVNTGKACDILRDDLRTLYSFLAGKNINSNAFGRMMSSNGFHAHRAYYPVGHGKMTTRPRCISVKWKYINEQELQQIRDAFKAPDNVAQLQQPEPQDQFTPAA